MANFTFLYPMWFLALVPLALLLVLQHRKKTQGGLIAPHITKQLGIIQKKSSLFYPLVATIWLCATVALAGPSFGYKKTPSFQLSGTRVLVLDMSRSLYATDIKPNRLEQMKYKAKDLLPYWKEGMTGLVTYANNSYLVSPLTQDSQTLDNLISNLSPNIMPYQGRGSNLSAAVAQSIDMMKTSGHQKGDIIVFTDGISDTQLNKVKALVNNTQWRVSLLGIGTRNGAPIELPSGKLLTDKAGKTAIATLDKAPLAELANITNGIVELIQSDNSDIEKIAQLTDKPLEQKAQNSKNQINSRANHGYWLLFPILLLSLFSFRKGIILALFLVILPIDKSMANPLFSDNYNAHQAFEKQNYQEASQQFTSPQWRGVAQYKAGDYKGAIDSLSKFTDTESQYNLANALAQDGQLEAAKEKYESILETNPDMEDAKKNLDIVNKALEQQEQQKQNNQDNQDNQNQQSDNSQDKNNADSSSQPEESNEDNKASKNQPEDQQQQPSEQEQQEQQQKEKDKESQQDKKASQSKEQEADKDEKKEQQKAEQEESESTPPKNNAVMTDPRLQKLEQAGRKEDELLRALLYLQAKQQKSPQTPENEW